VYMSSEDFFYIESLGELFGAVQSQKLFADAKFFVDCAPRGDVPTILSEYEKVCREPGFDLKLFVTTHFILPADLPADYLSANKPLLQHIEDLWTVLKRSPAVQSGTLVPLPYPYIVPGGRFREIFYWDSYFTMLGLQVSRHIDLIESMVNNFASLAIRIGHIPNGNRTYFLSRSQPPFFSFMVELLAEEKGPEILLQYLPALEKEYAFWMDGIERLSPDNNSYRHVVMLPDGSILNRYWDDRDLVRPEAYFEETKLALRSDRPVHEVHRHLRAACESGWDYSSRWLRDGMQWESIETAHIVPVDLNCLLLHLEETLLKIYSLRNDTAATQQLQTAIHKRFVAVQQYCWNEVDQFYFDYHFIDQQQTGKHSLAALYPLFCKLASPEQAQQVATRIEEKFLCEGGLLTTLIRTGQQWDAPNGWAPLQWIAFAGLRQYGFTGLANKVKDRWMQTCEKVYAETGKMMEKYDVMDINNKAGGGKYPNQDGFGWTNGVYLALLHA
jgi:alpha,alpha-trehalase